MSGYCYGEPEPLATCPYCGNTQCVAEFTDIGVGNQQTGPYRCEGCHAFEIGPYDEPGGTEAEKKFGWYAPDPALS